MKMPTIADKELSAIRSTFGHFVIGYATIADKELSAIRSASEKEP